MPAGGAGRATQPADRAPPQPVHQSTEVDPTFTSPFLSFSFSYLFLVTFILTFFLCFFLSFFLSLTFCRSLSYFLFSFIHSYSLIIHDSLIGFFRFSFSLSFLLSLSSINTCLFFLPFFLTWVVFHHSLRYLNASANKLESVPPATQSEESLSTLQELYLTNNSLTDKCVPLLAGHTHLRVLHLAFNQLQTFAARYNAAPPPDPFHKILHLSIYLLIYL